jgi:hypothetical protein
MSDPHDPFQDDEDGDQQSEAEFQDASEDAGFDWGGGELEAAYMKAMMALEASEAELPEIASVESSTPFERVSDIRIDRSTGSSQGIKPFSATPESKTAESNSSLKELFSQPTAGESVPSKSASASDVRVTPRQILEACLLVFFEVTLIPNPLIRKLMS